MDTKELRQKSEKELTELVATLREKLRGFSFDVASDSLKDVREIREAKKTLARTLTIVTERAKDANKPTTIIAK